MKFAILYLALLGQIPEDIQYCEPVKSKFYVSIILPAGNIIDVPVVNGFLPEVTTRQDSNGYRRVLNYNREIPYAGGIPKYLPSSQSFKLCTTPITIQVPKLTPIPQRLPDKASEGWVPKRIKPSAIEQGEKKPTY